MSAEKRWPGLLGRNSWRRQKLVRLRDKSEQDERKSCCKLFGHRAPPSPPNCKSNLFWPTLVLSGTTETAPTGRTPCWLSVHKFSRSQKRRRRRRRSKKINEASLDVSSRRCELKTKRLVQRPRRLSSRFQRGPGGWSDGCLREPGSFYKQDDQCRQESRSSGRMSPLWFGLKIWGEHDELLLCTPAHLHTVFMTHTGNISLISLILWHMCAITIICSAQDFTFLNNVFIKALKPWEIIFMWSYTDKDDLIKQQLNTISYKDVIKIEDKSK